MKILATLFVSSAMIFAQPAAKPIDKKAIEAYLRHVELWVPDVEVKVDDPVPSKYLPGFNEMTIHLSYKGQTLDAFYYISSDGTKILKGDVYDLHQNPYQRNLDRLKTEGQPSFGLAGGPVTIIMFSDFQCPVCKEEAQVIRTNLKAAFPDKVRVFFMDYPLDALHNWARSAAIAGRCVYRQNPAAFWDYFDWVYENQANIGADNLNNKLEAWTKSKGLDQIQFGRCVASKDTEAEVDRTVAEGHSVGVAATPTMFVNGRKIEGGIPWPNLEQLIKAELDHKAKNPDADDKCCEVTIPRVVK